MSERKKEVRYIASKFANAILADYSSYIISPDGLQAINAFLDELLFILIDTAKSLDVHRIKSAVYQTFPQALGKNAIVEAELEAKSYLEMGGKDVPKDDSTTRNVLFDLDSDVEQVFEQFRAKCQYYSKLGERLGSPAGNPAIAINVPTLLAIYVTAVLEHIAEYVLLISSSIADRQDHADMVTAKEVYMGLLEDRQTENVFEIMILKTQLQKRFFRQSLLVMNTNEPAQVKRSGSWGKQLRLGNADKPKIDIQLPMEIEDDPIDPNRPQFGDWDDDTNDEESRRKKKSEFEQLISSGETMKVSLTPNRLRTIEVHRKAGGGNGGMASRSSSRAASIFGGKHGRRPSHGERPPINGRKSSQAEAAQHPVPPPPVPEPPVPSTPPVPSLGGAKKQTNGATPASFPTPPASVRGSTSTQPSQPPHGLGITNDGRSHTQDGLFSTPFPLPPSHSPSGPISVLGATPPASPNGPDKQVPPPLNLASPQLGRTTSNNSVVSNGSLHSIIGGGRNSTGGPEIPMTPVSESGSVKKENPLKSFMGRLGRNSMSRESMEQQLSATASNGTSSPTSIRSFTIGGPGLSGQQAGPHSNQHGSQGGSSKAGSIQSNISSSSTLLQQTSTPSTEYHTTPSLASPAHIHETTHRPSSPLQQQHNQRPMSPKGYSLHQQPTSPTLGGPVAIPSRNASLNQEVTSPVSATFPSLSAAKATVAAASAAASMASVRDSSRSNSPQSFPLPPSHSLPQSPAATPSSQSSAQYPNKPLVPERSTSSPAIGGNLPSTKNPAAPAHVPWKPYTPLTAQSRASSFSGASSSAGSVGSDSGPTIPITSTLRANPFVQADVLKRESLTSSPKLNVYGTTPPALSEKSPVREALRSATAASSVSATATTKESTNQLATNNPSTVAATTMATATTTTSTTTASITPMSTATETFNTSETTEEQQDTEMLSNTKSRSSVDSTEGSVSRQYRTHDSSSSRTSLTMPASPSSMKQTESPEPVVDVTYQDQSEDEEEQLKSEKDRKAAAIAAAAVAAAAAAAAVAKSGRSSVEPSLSALEMPIVSKRQSIFVDEEAQEMDRLSTQRHRQSMLLDPDAEFDEDEDEDEDEDLDFLTEDDLISGYGQTTTPPPEKWHYTSDEEEDDDDDLEAYEDAHGEFRRRRHESFMSAKSTILPSGSTTSLPLRTDDDSDEEDEEEEDTDSKPKEVNNQAAQKDAEAEQKAEEDLNADADAEVEAALRKAQTKRSSATTEKAAKAESTDKDSDINVHLDFAAPDQGDMLPSQMKAAMLAAASAHAATTIATATPSDTRPFSVDSSTGTAVDERETATADVVTMTLAEQAAKLREERKAARDARRLAKQEERRRRKQADQDNRPPTPSTPIPTTQMIPLTPTDLVLIRQKVFSSGNFEASMRMLDTIFHAAMAKMVEGRERGIQTDPVLFADEVDSSTDDDFGGDEADIEEIKKEVARRDRLRLQAQKAVRKKKSLEVNETTPSAWVTKAVEQVQQQQQQQQSSQTATNDDDDEDRVVEWLLGGV
ncbi:hypothetical protein BGW42_006277 [Actinomortierella wolfii]|nr:hypothetical protein BGW42_006277 [Actinomortierella wolfii]